ncbi:asparagine synthetase B (glutamine-hydrolyzing) [Streptomyces achromogenes]|uniref:Asparagine synthetase B (Glutamine-hydrolyzing) n=1 Tax=Streptomyces achromogenes TaxID=67255 RepID=A0ABU0QDC5_STRAH|nr:hypothetical protein [Streptomyces achromogenes]MDQ0688660.1 asparagine synthetase B (glutamine-hydrolyzing) [Streptomyces achromogenes]
MVRPPEHAIFTGMFEVRPGHLIRVRRKGPTKHRYGALEAKEHIDSPDRTILTV